MNHSAASYGELTLNEIKPLARMKRYKDFSRLLIVIFVIYLTDNIFIIRGNKEGYERSWLKVL